MKVAPKITLHPKKERSLLLFHPWVFSGAIARVEGEPAEGDLVNVFSSDNKFLATGFFHNGSIRVSVISFTGQEIDEKFWITKIRNAYSLRERLSLTNNRSTNAYRLVHGEGDELPGLIIDIYGTAAVIQTHTIGIHNYRLHIVSALQEIYGSRLTTIYDKSSETLGKHPASFIGNGFLYGNESEQEVLENDIRFSVNWIEGQKTGFFLDQRDNRKLVERYSAGKKVLNTFSYSGGFSMYALKGGATLVHSVDSSAKAVSLANINARLNGFSDRHEAFDKDAFDYLKSSDEKYDMIILDPPAFAKHLSAVDNAMVGYRNLNTEGIKRVKPGGLVFTFSCSQVIDKLLFRKLIFQAAAQTRRRVKIIHQLSQGPDHPVNIYHPEGEYLKGLVLYVAD